MDIDLLLSDTIDVQEINFLDVEQLNRYCTENWSGWGNGRQITREDIDAFGTLTDNHQWIHEDDARCGCESIYGEVIAHGFFLLTLLPSLLPPELFTVVGHTHRIVRGGEWRFPSPVFVGDTIHVRSQLKEVRSTKCGTLLIRTVELWSHTGFKPAVTSSLQLQYF